jgi:hypothetical protein
MMQITIRALFVLSAVLLGAHVHAADTEAEWEELQQVKAVAARVTNAIWAGNSDWCPADSMQCPLEVHIGYPEGTEVFGTDHAVWLSIPVFKAARNDAELALLIGYEWAYRRFQHSGFPQERVEEISDCVGALFAARGGYDLQVGTQLYTHLASLKYLDELMLGRLGVRGGNKIDWAARVAAITKARAEAGGKTFAKADIERVCKIKS